MTTKDLSPLTPNELAAFTAMKKWEKAHFPIGPTLKDLLKLSGIKSPSTLHDAINGLIRKHYVANEKGDRYNRARSLRTLVNIPRHRAA
jgi:hypothetical protein